MNSLTIMVLLVGGFVESSAVAAVGLSLVGLDYDRKGLLLTGALQAFFICVARALPFRDGIHTFLLIISLMLLVHHLLAVRPLVALIASLTGICVLTLVEMAAAPLLAGYFAVTPSEILSRPFLRLGLICLNAVGLGIILHIIKLTDFAFIRAGKTMENY